MLTLKNTSVMNFENAIRGARNPMNSWGRMDSHTEPDGSFVFGPNDLDLAMRLAKAGSDHRKYLRMVFVSVDVTAPPDNASIKNLLKTQYNITGGRIMTTIAENNPL